MTTLKLLLFLLAHMHFGVATNFAAVDAGNPNPWASCLHRDLRDADVIVAHRTLPCNSRVFLWAPRTSRGVWARVGDRGPRHAMADLNVAVTKALHANGWEHVLMVPAK